MYEWVKITHILSVISWMVALLYLPRLYVYHSAAETGGEASETFKIMERRLMKGIMTPAMIGSWMFGLWLALMIESWMEAWFVIKLFLLILLSAFHGFSAVWLKEFARDERKRPQRFYLYANEFPTLMMIGIIILVVLKPFQ